MTAKYNPLLAIIIFILPGLSHAIQIKGVDIAPNVTQPATKQDLVLNGAGVRTKFVFSIYVGALYLTKSSHDAVQILNDPGSKRISMHFLYDSIEKEKMVDAWNSGFEDNLDDAAIKKLKPRIEQFNQAFGDTVKGDVVTIDFVENRETIVTINQQEKTRIPGADFQRALLAIWLGDEPVDDDLKTGMLGLENQ